MLNVLPFNVTPPAGTTTVLSADESNRVPVTMGCCALGVLFQPTPPCTTVPRE